MNPKKRALLLFVFGLGTVLGFACGLVSLCKRAPTYEHRSGHCWSRFERR